MKSSIIAASLFATLSLASPVKRAVFTKYTTVTVYLKPTTAPQVVHEPTAPATASALPTSSVSSSSSSSVSSSGEWTPYVDYGSLSDYAAPILKQHNLHRDNHTVSPLKWDDELASWAKQIAETCVYAHSNSAGDGQYGQNIGAGAPGNEVPKMITNDMYNGEMVHYPGYGGEPDMSNFEVWGHFSQIVWKNTESVGCYTNHCGSLANVGGNVAPYFTVCNYRPAGNYGGQYGSNVLKPVGDSTIVV